MPGNLGIMYLKKDCNGCKALQNRKCVLGYAVTAILTSLCLSDDSIRTPEEPCPKPRTYEWLNELVQKTEIQNRGATK